jgi:copper chaperone CopZ
MISTRLTLGAILTSAFAASLCCLGPLLVGVLGVGSASLFQQHFEAVRPYAMILTAALLGYGFYLAYRPAPACADGAVCDTRPSVKRLGKLAMWLVTLISLLLMFFPYYSGALLAGGLKGGPISAVTTSATTTLKIEGMTCGGCAVAVKAALTALPGVSRVEVTEKPPQAVVTHDPRLTRKAMVDAITSAGYGVAGEHVAATATLEKVASLSPLSVEPLREAFNRARDRVRVVAVLSPTCGWCQKGQGAMKQAFDHNGSDRLRGFVVWLPMLPNDDGSSAARQAKLWEDSRMIQGWDSEKRIGEAFRGTLKLNRTAWDVYLIYPPGVEWKGEVPPTPSFWMHQLGPDSGADASRMLDAGVFENEVMKAIKKSDS